jgi:hypothetical protein
MTTSTIRSKLGRIACTLSLAVTAAAAALSLQAASAQATPRPAAAGRTAAGGLPQAGTCIQPPGREWASFAYDPRLRESVLFGGQTASAVLGDTWTRHGSSWTQQHPASSPSARTGAALVYDQATGQLLLFGGSSRPFFGGGFFGDTWVWTGATWTQLHPATSPPARHNADMVFDAASHEVILFGGYDGSYLGDTWAWNGTTWRQLHPATAPSPRDSESLVYDAATQTAIMYGGFSLSTGRLSDTWSWNGTTWTQLSPAASPGVVTTAWQAAYDAATGQVVLFGGDPGFGSPLDQIWSWNGTTWTQLSPALAPPGRAYGSLTYDPHDQRILLFGGSTNADETSYPASTWEWDGTSWQRAG